MELVLVVFGIVLAVVLGLGGLLLAVFGLFVAKARMAALNPPPHPARPSPPVPRGASVRLPRRGDHHAQT